ncbi:MAG TPA: RNA-binding cell elongation regulator Jag/EloR [Chloroflexota bacterium]|jgi:spoIIIJ-associated protein|nr:RNA-binding cell elongation regulator Jag/EloR [Chloroflexota bacterium]
MSTGKEFRAKTVDAAIAEAEQQLGKTKDQLDIQVLSAGSKGVFGLGGEPARILVRDPAAEPEIPAPSEARLAEDNGAAAEAPEPRAPRRSPVARPPRPERERDSAPRRPVSDDFGEMGERPDVDPEVLAASAKEVVETMLAKMGFEVEVSVRSTDDPVTLDISGEDLGILIGRRGDSLAALQFMVNVILSKQYQAWPRVVVDVQGYRSRREQSLSSLGQRVAERVGRNRRPFTLEAMPANDRRVIHLSLRDRADIETYSIGEGPARRVVIAPKRS